MTPGRRVRPEEVLIGALLAVGVALCYASGTGFEWSRLLWGGYSRFLGGIGLYLFAASRLGWLARTRAPLPGAAGRRLRAWLGGPDGGPAELFAADVEFLRGLALMLVTVSVYTNVKVRLPFINPAVGDEIFQALDHVLLGERLVPWLERAVAASPWLTEALTRVYFFGHVWMVLLVLWLWVRTDRATMRWLFASFCVLYLVVIFVTALYPSYGPFFLDWERFRWAQGTMTGRTQASLVAHFLRAGEAVGQGKEFIPVAFAGIAAFPSLHVGQMILVAVVAWRTARAFGIFMLGVAAVTTVATLAFGWHYLVDALAGGALAVAVPMAVRRWSFSGPSATGLASKPPV